MYISDADISAGRQAYLVARVNFVRPQTAVAWRDVMGFVDFASQVGGDDT